jgi:hypothetical protein
MRRATGFAGGGVAELAKAGGRWQTRGDCGGFAVALGRGRFGGFEIAEKERFAYPYPDMEGVAHGAAGPRNHWIRKQFTRKQTRELSNR